ncbi:DNA damage-inducible protein 1 [Borealophlyctis nickersoniae]|nr:DNA damage-inducible protein 1 [Borealophlyctis nickersoniae]
MRLHLTNDHGDVHNVDVDPQMELENLQALAEAELGIPVSQQVLYHNGNELKDGKRLLSACGILQDDILLIRRNAPAGGSSSHHQAPQTAETQNPELANALMNNPAEFARMFNEIEARRREVMERQRATLAALEDADPFDVEAQRRIEAEIRKENIAQNMEAAMEHNPESFGRVVMLYINAEVNGNPVKAFVDSGAQATIMSPECAEACHIMHLLDERFAGTAMGVGTAKILGRVHSALLKVGNQYLACSFTIMEGKGVDLLFGLDMLKKHQACIDLEKNVLRINGEEVEFLSEHELPAKARWDAKEEAEDGVGPSGAASAEPPLAASSNPTPAPPPPSTQARSTSQAPASRHPEEKIKMLTDLGVTRQEAEAALDACQGNADLAANMLFNM